MELWHRKPYTLMKGAFLYENFLRSSSTMYDSVFAKIYAMYYNEDEVIIMTISIRVSKKDSKLIKSMRN